MHRRLVSISQSRFLSFQARLVPARVSRLIPVSISQSRCLSFQARTHQTHPKNATKVSISQSRCLSFQGDPGAWRWRSADVVSISQSRFLSFQAKSKGTASRGASSSFNLAIEILVISGPLNSLAVTSHCYMFQSRNRDSCHFRWHS